MARGRRLLRLLSFRTLCPNQTHVVAQHEESQAVEFGILDTLANNVVEHRKRGQTFAHVHPDEPASPQARARRAETQLEM